MDIEKVKQAAELIRKAKYAVAFTGAGISVPSGIPPFRGENGLWNTTDPIFLEIEFFQKKPLQSWLKIKEIFYDKLGDALPNEAHKILAQMQQRSYLESIITQNIDHLHQKAGSKHVYEIHGTYTQLICTACSTEYDMSFADLNYLPPTCFVCKGILKPDIVFFNEPIPAFAKKRSFEEAAKADVFLIIGTNAEVLPAADIPVKAKEHGATIIEINIEETHFTREITDIFLQGDAAQIMTELGKQLYL
ncbi:NAD-dependent protein deacylase [Maribellus luteus]|uniref:protein acetyllysine N-acetyltransferase n=1 Tax=Maribellus luteus TaxID=2305463 RepID=A0A399SYS8_9BACT|nr:NAD-dependent protein deacylase [Maribellus luteus]RIJ47201.1 NAD-dependent protein deacylase [Maribellus luteus]